MRSTCLPGSQRYDAVNFVRRKLHKLLDEFFLIIQRSKYLQLAFKLRWVSLLAVPNIGPLV